MVQIQSKEDTFNVMGLTIGIVIVVILVSIFLLWVLTKNIYLDSYFALDAFFDAQNTAGAEGLAALAFSYSTARFVPIFFIVMIDNMSRILITSFILAAVIDFLNYANIEETINEFRAKFLRNHVILCGYNDMADALIERLKKTGAKYVVIEPDKKKNGELNERRFLTIMRDYTKEDTFKLVKIEKAKAVVLSSENDVDNVVGAIIAKKLNPKIKILSRLKDEHARNEVYGIGVDMAIIPERLAGLEIGDLVCRSFGR